jgi:hypothetical protein
MPLGTGRPLIWLDPRKELSESRCTETSPWTTTAAKRISNCAALCTGPDYFPVGPIRAESTAMVGAADRVSSLTRRLSAAAFRRRSLRGHLAEVQRRANEHHETVQQPLAP